ncbi:DNA polymerase B [Pueribacillus theae]|uniref:DNA polymerase B n=1 Tax=Pueribacillus theae TaxID=2171751 RepID=A0A2U1JUL5_9BACI|nr:DNA polymerase domain-containing protein [Pueribacillus theae]PWA08634.1 DNA polymerase B [Pueribacillus theae]
MFTFYDFEVFTKDWLVVFEKDGQLTRIHNDRDALKRYLSTVQFLIGFNNYNYDDFILAALLRDMDAYEVSQQIIRKKKPKLFLNKPITLDVMQELKLGVGLKETQANIGLNIHETPVDFNLNRPLNDEEIERTFKYCENDVLTTKELFEKREDYFSSKFEIVQTFKLPAASVKKTRARLSADVLKCKKHDIPNDRINLVYDKRLLIHELPKDIVQFYKDIEQDFKGGTDFKELESRKYERVIAGVPHVFGFGGLHGAIENYVHEGDMMAIDVSSYYPSLMINNNFMSRASKEPGLFKQMYDERLRLKKIKDSKQGVYKIILNSTYGAMKHEYNPLYDPLQANNICVNGQLILTHLILLLQNFCKLIQSNTDGIIIQYDDELKNDIMIVLDYWQNRYQLSLDVDYIKKIAQRDVNNYVIQYHDGKVSAKGRFANFDGGDYERNSLTVIDKALVDHYIYDIPIHKTVIGCFKRNELDRFQLIAKAGSTFNGIVQNIDGEMIELQKVNRVFATNDKQLGPIYKIKNVARTKRYNKIPFTSENVIVHNDTLDTFNKRNLDLNWYIKETERWLF